MIIKYRGKEFHKGKKADWFAIASFGRAYPIVYVESSIVWVAYSLDKDSRCVLKDQISKPVSLSWTDWALKVCYELTK